MPNRDIIVIGGSSGASAAISALLGRLEPDLPAALFIVLHMPPGSSGILSTVTRAAGKLPVREAAQDLAIERSQVYVAVPDRHLLVFQNHMILGRGPRENMARPAIDALFRSAALSYGPRVIGIVLSGHLSDGAAGLDAIKRCGGLALVQDPSDAIADEMPRRALDATTVDLCASGARLGEVLAALVHERAGRAARCPPEIKLEVEIAAGEHSGSVDIGLIADPAPLTCPACGGVLSTLKAGDPLRFRCQVGHAYTADELVGEQEGRVDEAMRVALRIIEERAELVRRMAENARQRGRPASAQMYASKATEYRGYADMIRRAVLESFEPKPMKAQKAV